MIKISIDISGDGEMLRPINFASAMIRQGIFNTDDLEQLAEHLLVFCKHSKENGIDE